MTSGDSAVLQAFVAESPIERRLILEWVRRAAADAPAGSDVLDAGAGDAPYRELFAHTRYRTTDWSKSPHAGARSADIIASLDDLPVDDASFDRVLCTQVLEHVPDPRAVLAELHRVLRPGGRLWLTVPFVGELHEEPYDFSRFTEYGLGATCAAAGFAEVRIEPLSGYYTTVAQLLRHCGAATGVGAGREDLGRRLLAGAARALSRPLARLDGLDRRRALPLGYACTATRPANPPESRR